jgi:hypothetical protein
MNYLFIFIIFTLIYLYIRSTTLTVENYSENSGFYCSSCSNKTIGQCLQCYNCSVCDNKCINANVIDAKYKTKKCNQLLPNDIYWRNQNTNRLK